MPVYFTATATAKCWKQHICVACSCVYRYRMARSASASSGASEVARMQASQSLHKRLARGIERRPCPHCGQMQPDMVAKSKFFWHTLVLVVSGLLLGCVAIAGGRPDGVPIDKAGMTAAWIAGIAAVIHLLVALANPNADRADNRKRSSAAVPAGNMEVVRPGVDEGQDPAPPLFTLWHGLALLAVLAAQAAFLAPVFVGWSVESPSNADVVPAVVSPGDTVTLQFSDSKVESLRGLWRGEATVQVVNADEVGVPATLPAVTAADVWGPFRGKVRGSNSTAKLYARITIPAEPELVGKALKLKAALHVIYPSQMQGRAVDGCTLNVGKEFTIRVSSGEGAAAFRQAWSIGSTAGLAASVLGGFVLVMMAVALRARAEAAEVLPLTAPPTDGGPAGGGVARQQ
jgi:hypothetical protein